jgi:predicted PurR-regulated permease PerM
MSPLRQPAKHETAFRSRPKTEERKATSPTIGLFILSLLLVAYLARSFLLPIVLALLAYFLLVPAVRSLRKRLRIPEALGAALILVPLVGTAGITVYQLSAPAADWLERAPAIVKQLEVRLRSIRKSVEDVVKTAEGVQQLATGSAADADGSAPDAEEPVKVEVSRPGLTSNLFDITTTLIAAISTSIILLYFLLASGDTFLKKIVLLAPTDKQQAVEIVRCIERDISRYFGTVTVINAVLGIAAGIAMAVLGMPNPVLWGMMAFVSNFVPYLGAMLGTVMIALVSFITFPTLGQAAVPPLTFLGLTVLESELVTPFVLGRSLFIHPVVVFVGLLFWTFLWGIPGALLAVPLLFVIKVVCDHVESLKPLAEFMSSERSPEPAPAASPRQAPA